MEPPAEHVHWMFASGFLVLGLSLLAEAIVGPEVWRRRTWRAYFAPGFVFVMGLFMWPVMVFFTNSTIHTLAHSAWAQAMMLAGGAELALVRSRRAPRPGARGIRTRSRARPQRRRRRDDGGDYRRGAKSQRRRPAPKLVGSASCRPAGTVSGFELGAIALPPGVGL